MTRVDFRRKVGCSKRRYTGSTTEKAYNSGHPEGNVLGNVINGGTRMKMKTILWVDVLSLWQTRIIRG